MTSVYIGTSAYAAAVLESTVDVLAPALVVTRPPSARGRGRRLEETPVALAAGALGLEVARPPRLAEVADQIEALAPDVLVLCAYGELVREPLLSGQEILGVHPSLLPRWRGAAPIERALMAGDEVTGVSIMRLVAALDEGPVCASEAIAVELLDDHASLSTRLVRAADRALRHALTGPRSYTEQDGAAATYAEKITAADRLLDPRRSAAELERRVRALHPHIGARLAGGLGVSVARVAPGDGPPPGELSASDGRLLFGAAGASALELLRVKPPGGREMDAAAYLRGHGV